MGLEKVLDKVRKLRALASSSNIHEAEAAAAQADRLIQEHRLSEADLEAASDGPREAVGEDGTPLDTMPRIESWKSWLSARLAKHYGCYCYSHRPGYSSSEKRPNTVFRIAGRPSDVAIVRYMYAWLVAEITRLSTNEAGRAAKNAFRMGAVQAIVKKLSSSRAAAQAAHAQSHAGSAAAIVLASRSDEARAWAESAIGQKIGSNRVTPSLSDKGAFLRGVRAGDGIHLGQALPSGVKALPGKAVA